MSDDQPTPEKEHDGGFRQRVHLVNQCFSTARFAMLVGVIAYGIFEARRAIEALAGQTTVADIVLGFFSDLGSGGSVVAAWTFGAFALAYGYRQRTLHRRAIIHFQDRVKKLEAKLDPNRSSSALQIDGKTRPEDRYI